MRDALRKARKDLAACKAELLNWPRDLAELWRFGIQDIRDQRPDGLGWLVLAACVMQVLLPLMGIAAIVRWMVN